MSHQEPAPTLTTTEMIRHLWRFRIYFLILPPIFFVAAYLYVRTFLGETFETNAMLLIRTPASAMTQGEPHLNTFDPPVYVDYLKSDEILFSVIEAARAKFKTSPKPYTGDFEKIKSNFSIESIMTRDTSVQATYSPVLSLSVKAKTAEIAKFLADEWLRQIVDKYGRLRMRQAQQIRTIGEEQAAHFGDDALKLQQQEVQLEQTLEALDLKLDANARILAGSTSAGANAGLYELRVREKISVAGADTAAAPAAKARLDTVEKLLVETEKDSASLGEQKARLMGELEKVRRDLVSARLQLESAREVFTNALVDAAEMQDPLNPENSGDLIILSKPVKPEVRIAPPRSVLAAVFTVFLTGLVAIVFLANLYLKRSVLEGRS